MKQIMNYAMFYVKFPNHAKKYIKLHEGGTKTLLDLVVPPKHGKNLSIHILLIYKKPKFFVS